MLNTKATTPETFWRVLTALSSVVSACALLIAFAATALSLSAHAEQTRVATADAPDAVATNFYSWYLKELSHNRDPLTDSGVEMKTYVSGKTLQTIHRKINSPDGMEADYFIQTQDYMDEWLKPPKSQTKKLGDTNSELIITLGEHTKSKYKLAVSMLKEEGRWKISKVIALTH